MFFFILGFFWTEGYGFKKIDVTGETVEEAIIQNLIYNVLTYKNIVEDISLDPSTKLVFYANLEANQIYANLVKKKWNGKWKVVDASATLTQLSKAEYAPYMWGLLKTDEYMGMWGIILDPDVETVMVKYKQEEKATVIKRPGYPRIWYKLYQTEGDTKEIEAWAIDSNGKEIPWDKEQ